MDIKDKVLNYIKNKNLISHGDSLICAVSGGADSVCMLDILVSIREEFSLSIYVAHLNHNLRGDEAKRDELFVKSLCENYSLPFYSKTVDVKELSKELKVSCEEAGRIARYEFFSELKKELNAVKVSTAHNKNDNVETVLMRMFRGTDLKGLSGISPLNDNSVIRPILCLSRDEIENYLRCKGLSFVTDSTNLENNFTRNKIRNTLIPSIKEDYNEKIVDVFSSNIELFDEANSFVEKYVDERFNELAVREDYGIYFDASSILKEDIYIAKRIIKKAIFLIDNLNITNNLCNIIYDSLTKDNINSISDALKVYFKYGKVYFVKENKNSGFLYRFDNFGTYYIQEIKSFLEINEFNGVPDFRDKNTIFLPYKKDFNFVLRSRKNGDRINLLRCGTKKISDIFTDEKIPSFLRDEIPIFEYNKEIIWICNLRKSAIFSNISNNKYIKISLHKEQSDA